ncbi:DUF342 domain-containing protein [Lachnoclostridium sp.]|uniref:DUF342 domain-containing protein n=1 Tax=Lachnoclostridium sp. TaxID=2028282 RepID=UPI002898AA51|nr:FapA family protein [Lachnoclostridium sp.]
MANDNAIFQLITNNDGTYLQLIPAKGLGKTFLFNELDEYLTKRRIDYDKVVVNDALLRLTETKIVKLNNAVRMPEGEGIKVTISDDRMEAVARFYPPSPNGSVMNFTEIINDLVKAGVKYGVVEENVKSFLNERIYLEDIVLARGTEPVQGKNAVITYYFNTDLTRKPKENEDGTVDFHQLDTISRVSKGALLANLVPAIQGRPGISVVGAAIQPDRVEHKILRTGTKTKLSEDGGSLYSLADGHALLSGEKVNVSDSFEIKGDVDASTGDIEYDGNVSIKGSVRTGYKVIANGDIIVDGVVEGALLQAGGQIILKRGIQGMNKGALIAASNIVSKFIENAEVRAGGYITSEALLHSRVSARGDVIVGGKKGFITGGEIRSGTMIHAKTAGSTMGTNTLLEVGVDPTIIEEYRRIEKELPNMNKELEQLTQNLLLYLKKFKGGENLPLDKKLLIKSMSVNKDALEKKKAESIARMEELQSFMDDNESGCIKISDTIYPGCKVAISNVVYYVRNETVHCSLVRDRADIKVGPY